MDKMLDKRWEAILRLQKMRPKEYKGAQRFGAPDHMAGCAIDEIIKDGYWNNLRCTLNTEQIVRRGLSRSYSRIKRRAEAVQNRFGELTILEEEKI
jgi:hypothetical protein